jgi:hypothetical protein
MTRQGSEFMARTKNPNAPTLIRACLSLDESTQTLLEKIRHKFHLTKANASKMIVGLALEKKIKLAEVAKFHQEVWSNLSVDSGQRFSQLIVDWTHGFPFEAARGSSKHIQADSVVTTLTGARWKHT